MNTQKLLNRQLGYYKLKRLIGVGGMGTVFVGEHVELEIEYAVKVLTRSDEAFVARFKREAQRAALLDHPHIARVFHYGYDTDHDVPYLVMTLVNGKELRDHLQSDGPMPLSRAATIATQVADALQYAHGCDIIHRDIKPDNILLEAGDRVKIVDFGLAKLTEEQQNITAADQVLGTPEYMALEQWEGHQIDHRVDIYALGITLYEMVTGKQPFTGTPSRIFTTRLNNDFKRPREIRPDLPEAFEGIVLKMMAANVADRYASAGDVVAALAPFADPIPTSIPTKRSASQLSPPNSSSSASDASTSNASASASGDAAPIPSAASSAASDDPTPIVGRAAAAAATTAAVAGVSGGAVAHHHVVTPSSSPSSAPSAPMAERPASSPHTAPPVRPTTAIPVPGSPEAGRLMGSDVGSGRAAIIAALDDSAVEKGTFDMSTLFLPPNQKFTCQHTGECCAHWQIPVSDERAEGIGKHEWGSRLPHLVNESAFVPNRTGPGQEMNLEANDGHCPFHDTADHRCAIHELLGGHAKPLACQQFPYRFTVTPVGTFVSLSFSCPTVRKSIGKPIVEQSTEIKDFTKRSKINLQVPDAYQSVTLLPGRSIDWNAIIRVEKVMDDVVSDATLPVWKALIAGERLTAQLQVIAETGKPEGKQIAPPEKIVDRLRGEAFVRPRFAMREKMFWAQLANLLRSRRSLYWATHSSFSRVVHRARGMQRYMRLLIDGPWGMNWKYGNEKLDGKEIRAADAMAVSPTLPADADELVRRFVRVKLFGNDFFGPAYNRLSFIGGYRFLMASIGYVMFLARSRAAVRGSSVLEFEDVDFGVGTVADCFFSTNTLDTAWFGTTVEAMMTRRPGVARKFLLRWLLDPQQTDIADSNDDSTGNETTAILVASPSPKPDPAPTPAVETASPTPAHSGNGEAVAESESAEMAANSAAADTATTSDTTASGESAAPSSTRSSTPDSSSAS